MAGFAENAGVFPYMVESVRRTLFSSEPVGVIAPNGDGWTAEVMDWNVPENQDLRRTLRPSIPWRYFGGRRPVSGRLIGGCLEVLGWLRGTSVWPLESDFDEAILFLETSEETPAPAIVARELRALGAMGILARLSGLIVGRPGGSEVSIDQFDDYDRAVLGVVHEEAGLSDLAVVTQMDFGHTDPMFVLPYGVTAQIDPLAHTFAILESAVTD
jgi:muramoyltetrapeptide carboxypeptidase LdcA involved in peptidoglycan recycling